jgi:hypothetical protein
MSGRKLHTEFLLDHFEDLLLVKLLGQSLDCGQGLSSIALYWGGYVSKAAIKGRTQNGHSHGRARGWLAVACLAAFHHFLLGKQRTLDTDVDIILCFLRLASVFVGFGEGICEGGVSVGVRREAEIAP